MTLIIFIRHAQAVSNVNKILSDDQNQYPLTDEGRAQAKNVAKELKKIPKVAKLYSSPILRAYQTASIIGEELGIVPIIDDRLRERGLGELNNYKIDGSGEWRLKIIKRELIAKGLESWDSMIRRMYDFVKSVLPEENIIAVSHYDPIRAFISYLLGLDEISAWGISLPNASITILKCKYIPESCKIIALGSPILTNEILSRL